MTGFGWLTIRQAKEALKNGRPEEAQRLLSQGAAEGHQRSWELLQKTGEVFLARGVRLLAQENNEGAWNDLLAAEQLGIKTEAANALRQMLTKAGLAEARDLLDRGEPARTLEVLKRLDNRMVKHHDLTGLEVASQAWITAREQAGRGEFAQAKHSCERIARYIHPANPAFVSFSKDLDKRNLTFSGLLVSLHEAALKKQWRDVVRLSEEVLAVAPQHLEARKARARAWRAIEPETVSSPNHSVPSPVNTPARTSPRFLLWIDGVGGFLVCLGNQAAIGQAMPDATVEIPLFADISRVHARLTRESEGYLLEAVRPVLVNSQAFEKGPLHSGDRITLGATCQMHFRLPTPVSASARLDMVSGHRFSPSVDAVLLMAETLVLGPGEQAHVTLPELDKPVVLFRQREGLGIRYAGAFKIDGSRVQDRGSLGASASVSGDEFAFAIEPAGSSAGQS
ncbi:MAG TPA: FHA domain-containing protein [Gemmataceae bacterium]|nr:FHA domain-containing protein [Gemmataceae bacterium]